MDNKRTSVSAELLASKMASKNTAKSKQPSTDNSPAPQPETQLHFALGKQNYLLIALSFLLVIAGFVLMLGSGTTETQYNPDIFSTRRIVIAPSIAFLVFVCMLFAKLRKPNK